MAARSKTNVKKVTSPKQATPAAGKPLSKLGSVLPWLLVICGVIGIIASIVITQDKFDLARNASFQPSCNLNPIISCGSVMKSSQAHAFGFMNPYIGLIGFPIIVAVGMGIFAGAKYKRWFWQWFQVGLTFGILFTYWLLFESIYRIHALCPWCLSVDVVLTTLFWYVTLYNFYTGNFTVPASLKSTGRFVKQHHLDLLLFWFIIVVAVILQHFWYYFGQHL